MKQRFSSLDVRVIAHELSNSLVSLRLANVYDLSSRIFLLKFAKPDHREQLLVDSGFRCHLTSFARATAAAPSPFVARLRKFLRTRRVTKVEQIGTDRVIELQFSDGTYKLFLEFYAGGNIVLTDNELNILGLLRNVSEGAEHEQYRLGLKYDLSLRQNFAGVPPLTKERLRDGLQKAVVRQQEEAKKPGRKIKKKAGDALRKALAVTTTEFPPVLIDHALHVTGYDRDARPEQVVASEDLLDKLLQSLQEAQNVVKEITSAETAKGYILAKRNRPATEQAEHDISNEAEQNLGLMYDDFHPFKPAHLTQDSVITFLEYDGFNKTADKFFSSIEGQKLESRLQEREDTAKRKIEQARQEQVKRIDGLQQVQEMNIWKAQAIEANVERVEEAIAAVNSLIAQGMDWVDIGRLIENEQGRRNPVAEMIKLPLKLHENTVTLLLSESDKFDDEGFVDATDSEPSDSEEERAAPIQAKEPQDNRLTVDIDLSLSSWANSRQYYDQKRSAAVKQEKTAQASQKALKSTEQKVMADLKKGLRQEKEVLRPVRKQMWFEKFIYFVSSDGYLVLAGKDAQQNEILYRRYLKKGDIYIHADLHGAASIIIKNNPSNPEAPIPPSTLGQAGQLAVCTSGAWESKAVMSAWWVNADQVSKTAPTGEYLTTGGFMIRGRKNYLPPAQLLLGFALLFQISEQSKAKHVKHRLRDVDTSEKPDTANSEAAQQHSDLQMAEVEDEDDEFPDAVTEAADSQQDNELPDTSQTEDVEDDDFPDAEQVDDGDDGNVEGEDAVLLRDNPLQKNGAMHQDPKHFHENRGVPNVDEEAMEQENEEPDEEAEEEEKEEPSEESKAPLVIAETEENAPPSGMTRSSDNREQPKSKPKTAPQVRGKRGKTKKATTKYADQDDEDREMAMRLLGSRAAEEKRQAEAAAKAGNSESAAEARARRRAQHEKAQKEGLEAEEIRRLNLEEGVEALDDEESSALTQLDALVGMPFPGDEILEAIPVCAPWAALGKFKYKAKIQPGQQKKGKACREILGKWTKDASDIKKLDQHSQDIARMWPREAELIRGLKEVEVVGVIPVKNVRVMMSGGGSGAEKGKGGGRGGKSGGKGSKRTK